MRVIRSRFLTGCWDGFLTRFNSKKEYLGFVYCNKSIVDVFQLKLWSDEEIKNCVCSEVERQRERSETRR